MMTRKMLWARCSAAAGLLLGLAVLLVAGDRRSFDLLALLHGFAAVVVIGFGVSAMWPRSARRVLISILLIAVVAAVLFVLRTQNGPAGPPPASPSEVVVLLIPPVLAVVTCIRAAGRTSR